jgi:hypothetical protein
MIIYILLQHILSWELEMRKISLFARVCAVICLISALSGCGQKGDLYLPDAGIVFVLLG